MNLATGKQNTSVVGGGSATSSLSADEITNIVSETLNAIPAGSRVLSIVPDKTRDDNTEFVFSLAVAALEKLSVARHDVLIAQGTHPAMSATEKTAKLGIADSAERQIFDHRWNDPDELAVIGELDAVTVTQLSDGLYNEPITLTVNRRLANGDYDQVLIFGAVVPHEVAGFAGGAKYLFPGVSGPQVTNTTHWIGALAGIENVIGRVETPARRIIEAAADHVKPTITCFSSVVSRDASDVLRTHAIFGGDFRTSFRAAAEVSRDVHIRRTGRKYRRVVAMLDSHYDELWTGGKASYKLGGIIEDGGELIIFAPHLVQFSATHGEAIERHGYAPVEAIVQRLAESPDLRSNLCVAAHLAHVAYASRGDNGEPRFLITLASQIDESRCRSVNLGYLDPSSFDIDRYVDDDTLIVQRAGRDLYLV